MKKTLQYLLIPLVSLLSTQQLISQSLSGIWEGEYTHYFPHCCDETKYTFRFTIYEDGRGVYWAESSASPDTDPHAIGRFFTAGFKIDEKIFFSDIRETFNSNAYTESCFKNCRWCRKEYSLRYKKQGSRETLEGVWNSKSCHPGGNVTLTKKSELPPDENVRLIVLGKSHSFDPVYMRNLYPPLRIGLSREDSTVIAVRVGGANLFGDFQHFKVDNPTDIVERKEDFVLQNVTSRLNKNSQMEIIYYELRDKKTGKIYTHNPNDIPPGEVMNLDVSVYGVTFPDQHQWDEILERASVLPEAIERDSIEVSDKVVLPSFKGRKVVANEGIKVTNDEIELHIWDHSKVDGDIVSIYLNDESVLKKYTLAKEKKVLKIKLHKGVNIITFYAENLGSIPPNTAAVNVFSNGKQIKSLIMRSDLKKSEAIRLILE